MSDIPKEPTMMQRILVKCSPLGALRIHPQHLSCKLRALLSFKQVSITQTVNTLLEVKIHAPAREARSGKERRYLWRRGKNCLAILGLITTNLRNTHPILDLTRRECAEQIDWPVAIGRYSKTFDAIKTASWKLRHTSTRMTSMHRPEAAGLPKRKAQILMGIATFAIAFGVIVKRGICVGRGNRKGMVLRMEKSCIYIFE